MTDNKQGFIEKADAWAAQRLGGHLVGIFLLAFAFWVGAKNSLTIAQVVEALAHMPVWAVVFGLVLDYWLDVGGLYKRALGNKRKGRFIYTVLITSFTALVIAWVLVGISGLSRPLGVFLGLMFALVVLLPRTGTSAVMAWAYIAALIVEGVPPTIGIEEIKAAMGMVV